MDDSVQSLWHSCDGSAFNKAFQYLPPIPISEGLGLFHVALFLETSPLIPINRNRKTCLEFNLCY